ncbi:MAG: DUF3108 domain-containing protein [Sideroxyarcus sp.]
MNLKLDTTSRRFAFAVVFSLLLHGLVLWIPGMRMPHFESALPPLEARLEALPVAPAQHTTKRKTKPAIQAKSPPGDAQLATSNPVATEEIAKASEPEATETFATETYKAAEHPALPRRAQLTFSVSQGTSRFRVGETVHTLQIDDGHYVIHAVTKTVGLVKLFKHYELIQDSSGSYTRYGLQPERFSEERIEKPDTRQSWAEFDHAAQLARFSHGAEVALPPDTQDILSILYQFPSLTDGETATISVSNGKKIEQYQFRIVTDEEINTAIGKLLTVRMSKLHGPDEEGLEIWLAREYRLFPVKMRFIEKNGDVTGEAVITDIRVSEEQGERNNAVN